MADQSTELRRINWSECFPFTNIFKTFRIAIGPGKLGLALAALILTGVAGWVLDAVWSTAGQPVKGEVDAYWQVNGIDAWRENAKKSNAAEFRGLCQESGAFSAERIKKLADTFQKDPVKAVDEAIDGLKEQYAKATKDLGKGDEDQKELARQAAELGRTCREIEALRPQGVFRAFLSYETACVRQMLDAARVLNFSGQLNRVMTSRAGGLDDLALPGTPDPNVLEVASDLKNAAARLANLPVLPQQPVPFPSVKTGPEGFGVLSAVFLMLRGFQWLLAEHWFFAVLFMLISLAIWSLFGGAITRIAAMNFAKDERVEIKPALAFAGRKFLGFFSAPLLPILMIVGIGVCLFVGGLFLAIPYIGELVGGALMGLSLLGGFVIALVVLGAVGGFGLMWPTIAVEGSDGFDAISRSYSYLYSRPWRTAFYAVVATVYGSFCYLFVRFFVLIMLKSTRFFVELGAFGADRPGLGLNANKLDAMWADPSFESLYRAVPAFGAEGWDRAGAFLISIWLLLVVGLLCSFLASFFLSGSTIVYYLLRREVDATDLGEVFVEEEPQASEAPAFTAPAPAAVAAPSPVEPAPPSPGPSGDNASLPPSGQTDA